MALHVSSNEYSDVLVILGAAGLVIPAFARARISPVIGFILVGVLVGPAGLGRLAGEIPWLRHITITDPPAIEPFAEFGIILLLFSIGLELSFRRLWELRREVFGLGAAELFVSGLLIAAALILFGQASFAALGLGIALALSSTALVLPIAGAATPVGRLAFAMLLFEDVALVPILFALAAFGPGGADSAALLQVLLTGGLTIAAIFLIGRLVLPRVFAQAARTKSPELFFAASLLVVVIASLATEAAGLSPIIGALLAGLLIAETDYHREVEVITAPFKGLALGVFLISVGMRLDLAQLAKDWQALLGAIAGVVAIKTLVTFALLKLAGQRNSVAAETSVMMGSPSETTLIVLATAAGSAMIAPATINFWEIVTALGLTLTPMLASLGRLAARAIDRRQGSDRPEEIIPPEGAGVVVIGFGRVGRMVADMLAMHGKSYVAVEADIDCVTAARREGYAVLFGDVSRSELVDRLNLGRAQALVLTMDDPVLTVHLTRRVRGWVPNLTIIARARDTDHAAELYKAGVTDAVPETLESSLQLAEAVLTDLGVAVGPVIASIHDKRDTLRKAIKDAAEIERTPRLARSRRRQEAAE